MEQVRSLRLWGSRTLYRRLALTGVVLTSTGILFASCSATTTDSGSSASTEAGTAVGRGTSVTGPARTPRPAAIDASVSSLPNGHSLREAVLNNVYVPVGGRRGVAVSIHPTSDAIQIQVPQLPAGGSLLVCPVDGPLPESDGPEVWVRTAQACTSVDSPATTPVTLNQADGNTHVGLELDGNWPSPVYIGEAHLTYEAVDDHFYVDFAVP